MAKAFILIGVFFILGGLFFLLKDRFPFLGFIGNLPGDIHIKRDGVQFSFPIVTCLLVSLILTFLLRIFKP